MPKKHILPADPEFTTADTAVMMFATQYPNYEFILELNDAYGMQLSRVDNITVDESSHPCYCYSDELARLDFVIIYQPEGEGKCPCFTYYDKMLLVRGRDRMEFLQQMYHDLHISSHTASQTGLSQYPCRERLHRLTDNVFDLDYFDLGGGASSLRSVEDRTSTKATTLLRQLKTFLNVAFKGLPLVISADIYDDDDDDARLGLK